MPPDATSSVAASNTTLEKIVAVCLPYLERESLGVPKYARFYNAVVEAVREECLVAGDKLPSEQVLSTRLPASLGTLQKALKALADDGVIVRQHGRGTFIRDQRMKHEDIRVFRFVDRGRPLPLALKGLGIFEIGIDKEFAEFFGATRCAVVQRLVRIADEPWTFNEFYLPLDLAGTLLGMEPTDFDGFSLHEYLWRRLHIPIARFGHQIAAAYFSAAARQALNLDADTSLGLIWRVRGYSRQNRPITYQKFEMHSAHRPIELETQVAGSRG